MRKISICKLLCCLMLAGIVAGALGCETASERQFRARIEPPDAAIDQIAVANAAKTLHLVFGKTVEPSQIYLYETGGRWNFYQAGKQQDYVVATAADTGKVLFVSQGGDVSQKKLTRGQREIAARYVALNDRVLDGEDPGEAYVKLAKEMDESCMEASKSIIMAAFGAGRTIMETRVGSVCSDNYMTPMQLVSTDVRMNEGTCYSVEYVWPQMDLNAVSIYDLGWEACKSGAHFPDEMN